MVAEASPSPRCRGLQRTPRNAALVPQASPAPQFQFPPAQRTYPLFRYRSIKATNAVATLGETSRKTSRKSRIMAWASVMGEGAGGSNDCS